MRRSRSELYTPSEVVQTSSVRLGPHLPMLSGMLRESLAEHAIISGGVHFRGWPTLLVVDQSAEMLQTLVCYFEKRGFHVAATTTLAEAKVYFQRRKTWT